MTLSPLSRKAARMALALTAIACLSFITISVFATLAAGTMQMDGGFPDGPGYLLLSSLSVVRFTAAISTYNSESNHITMHWFLNAFGWEWPTSGRWATSTGIINNITGFFGGPSLMLPADLAVLARRLDLSRMEYECVEDRFFKSEGSCSNAYFAAWHKAQPSSAKFGTSLAQLVYWFTFYVLFVLVIQEVIMKWFPSLTKCYCPGFLARLRWCACLKEDEDMTPAVRLRMRLWAMSLLVGSYILATFLLLGKALMLVWYLNSIDSQIGGGLEVTLGTSFLRLSVLTTVAILLAMLCLKLRATIGGNRPWIEGQVVDREDDEGKSDHAFNAGESCEDDQDDSLVLLD